MPQRSRLLLSVSSGPHAAGAATRATHADSPSPFAFSIAEAVAATGDAVSRTRMFALIRDGEIDARKVGRRTIILADSLRDFLHRAPPARPNRTAA